MGVKVGVLQIATAMLEIEVEHGAMSTLTINRIAKNGFSSYYIQKSK